MPVIKEELQKLCIIGAGPCALSLLYHMRKRLNSGQSVPATIKCFDKIGSIGGNWNLTTQTGLDETGDPVNSAMYKHMWLIAPREAQDTKKRAKTDPQKVCLFRSLLGSIFGPPSGHPF